MKHIFGGVLVLALVATSQAQFSLFAAESPAGGLGGNTGAYGGIQQYDFSSHADTGTAGAGVAAGNVHDPVGLVFQGNDLFVGNRHGNTTGTSSVQHFTFDGTSLTGGATVATAANSSHQGFHGLNFGPDGDMWVATVGAGARRFTDSGGTYTDIGGFATGAIRDVMVSADGKLLYQSGVGSDLKVTEIATGNTTNFGIAGANATHQMAMLNGDLYVTSFNSGTVHKILLDADFMPVSSSQILSVSGAIGITFTPDGQEMFVSSHTGNSISRFMWNGADWESNGTFDTGHNMGYLAAVPEPTTMLIGFAGLAALARRRKKSS